MRLRTLIRALLFLSVFCGFAAPPSRARDNYEIQVYSYDTVEPVAEGRERLEHYQEHGATPFSFWSSEHFPEPADEAVCV
jgi:hypothetical protein